MDSLIRMTPEVSKCVRQEVMRLKERLLDDRRNFHRHPEPGWLEFRTATLVKERLESLGYRVCCGQDAVKESERMGVPDEQEIGVWYADCGIEETRKAFCKGGFTGVVGKYVFGDGPVVALRFDLDALPMEESHEQDHLPYREGFCSEKTGAMHACGHDGHAALGLSLAEMIVKLSGQLAFSGTIKLIFQPAEEGVRGARAMVQHVDDVHVLVGAHLWPIGSKRVIGGLRNILATTKLDAEFIGAAAHAGKAPEDGRNALMAASHAVLGLQSAPRHSSGLTRVNVGTLRAGAGRNIIPERAVLQLETRGATTEGNTFVEAYAKQVLSGAALMYGCDLHMRHQGQAPGASSTESLAQAVERCALTYCGFSDVDQDAEARVSEDISYFMERVQENGGLATMIGVGMAPPAGLHNSRFDIPDEDLLRAAELLGHVAVGLLLPD